MRYALFLHKVTDVAPGVLMDIIRCCMADGADSVAIIFWDDWDNDELLSNVDLQLISHGVVLIFSYTSYRYDATEVDKVLVPSPGGRIVGHSVVDVSRMSKRLSPKAYLWDYYNVPVVNAFQERMLK